MEAFPVLRFPGLFLLLALIAGAFGFGGLDGSPAEFFKTLFFVLVGLAVLGCILNRTRESIESMDQEVDDVGDRTQPVTDPPVSRRSS
jgi:uncharacterized membrane protein YtjA (UPF0391 family)